MTAASCQILVTGSSGFVGMALVSKLAEKGYSVTGLDIQDGIDITDWDQIKETRNFQTIIHLAARTSAPRSLDNPEEFFRNNIDGTLNILELSRMRGAKFIFAGSYVYGVPRYLPVDEKHPVSPHNPYAQSKLVSEELCRRYHRDFGLPVVILRFFNLYGLGQRGDFLVPRILDGLGRGEIRLRDPAPRRDFLCIDDALAAYLKALEYKGSGCEIFNIGYGRSVSVNEVAELAVRLSGRPVPISYDHRSRPDEIADTVADTRKAGRLLGWSARTSIDTGLREVLEAANLVVRSHH